MGHRQQMTPEQRFKFDIESYKRKLEVNRGNNFQYWNIKHDYLLDKGWSLYKFKPEGYEMFSTSSLDKAKEIVEALRISQNHARIICGYDQNVIRIKRFSVIFKSKNSKS